MGSPKKIPLTCLAVAVVGLCSFFAAMAQDTAQASHPSAPSVAPIPGPKAPGNEVLGISSLQAFKNFLSSPPIIESLVFRERLPAYTNAPWREDIPFAASQNFRYYEVRYEPGAYHLREISSPDAVLDERTPGLLAACVGDQWWFHYGRGYYSEYIQFGVGPTNRVAQVAYFNSDVLRRVLTLGLMSEIGAVEWDGNRFHVSKDGTPPRFLGISGVLTSSPAGLADTLTVTYSTRMGDIDWVIRYAYENPGLPAGLPSVIRCFWIKKDQETECSEYVISQLKMALAPQTIEAFRPEQLVATNRWAVHFYTNDEVYLIQPGGERTRIEYQGRLLDQNKSSGAPGPAQVGAIYTIWAGANFWMFVLARRMSTGTQKKHEPSERKEV